MAENTVPEGTRAEHIAALLHNVPKPDDHDGVHEYLRAMLDAGLSVLLVKPGTKEPFDGRTPRQRTADDKAARDAARQAGNRNWMKVRSPSGVRLAADDPDVLDGYVDRYIDQYGAEVAVNAAVCPGRSRLVVVDCDTAEQVSAFLADANAPLDTAPTVSTPGVQDEHGVWKHSDGGHWWFTVPEGVELPDGVDSLTDPGGGYSIVWGPGRYALVPPSERTEGSYAAAGGGVHPLPEHLHARILAHGSLRTAPHTLSARHSAISGPLGARNRLLGGVRPRRGLTSWPAHRAGPARARPTCAGAISGPHQAITRRTSPPPRTN